MNECLTFFATQSGWQVLSHVCWLVLSLFEQQVLTWRLT